MVGNAHPTAFHPLVKYPHLTRLVRLTADWSSPATVAVVDRYISYCQGSIAIFPEFDEKAGRGKYSGCRLYAIGSNSDFPRPIELSLLRVDTYDTLEMWIPRSVEAKHWGSNLSKAFSSSQSVIGEYALPLQTHFWRFLSNTFTGLNSLAPMFLIALRVRLSQLKYSIISVSKNTVLPSVRDLFMLF